MTWPEAQSQGEILAAEAPSGVRQLSSWARKPGSDPGSTTDQDRTHITGGLRSKRDDPSQVLATSRHVVGAQVNAAAVVLIDELTAPKEPLPLPVLYLDFPPPIPL